MVKIEIDNQTIEARDGAMVIEAADEAGIYIPRFCYHKKLSVAANCRMCLISVEKARKPLPACATPVTDGMKVSTKSQTAVAAQKGVMEFLLINHPLDCPICDQAGECELQDVAVGYGNDASRYTEIKRVIPDKDIGPLISTEMTRCIHCTRCVRFGEEIAGVKELGATGRGEHMQIGTYVEHAVESEMSGNIIDLCPVGALTSKPFRFSARAWEMKQYDTIAFHDCVGSNLHAHVLHGEVKRIVPQDNENINETWISNRDRFSYEGLNSSDRATQPMIKENGEWKTTDWETALNKTFVGLNKALNESVDAVGFLSSPGATTEEQYLFQKLARSQGVNNLDYRLRQQDFTTQAQQSIYPALNQRIVDLESLDGALLIGSNIRKDQPIAGHRLRKAALHGAKVSFLNTAAHEFRFPVLANIAASPADMVTELSAILGAAVKMNKSRKLSGSVKKAAKTKASQTHVAIAQSLLSGEKRSILLGSEAINHVDSSTLETLASALAKVTGATLGYITDGPNSAGASIVGVLPHRSVAGAKVQKAGLNAAQMLAKRLDAYVLLGIEPEFDTANPQQSLNTLREAGFVVSLSAFISDSLKEYADVILPIATSVETAGTFVNAAGDWQSFNGCVPPKGEARPAWKVLRVLGNLFEAEGFEQMSVEDILDEIQGYTNNLSNSTPQINTEISKRSNKQPDLVLVGGVAV
ncbi:MAG TPA: NADH-quinone oxidoreductase subunit G, partial [Gammaproteobacteria bacterium]|nr:NADH-quinone oxidoreductase subunit G [Gammaproteobacteria bacterium]